MLMAGCAATSADAFETCEITFTLEPESASPGEAVTAVGGPFMDFDVLVQQGGSERDTLVTVGGVRAEVASVDALNAQDEDTTGDCELCDECREDARCAACGLCDGRLLDDEYRAVCFGDPLAGDTASTTGASQEPDRGACGRCVQQLSFVLPEVEAGEQPVAVVNRFGASPGTPITVVGSQTTTPTTAP